MAKSKSYKKKLPKYAPGGETEDPRKRMAAEAAKRKSLYSIPTETTQMFNRPIEDPVKKAAVISKGQANKQRLIEQEKLKRKKEIEQEAKSDSWWNKSVGAKPTTDEIDYMATRAAQNEYAPFWESDLGQTIKELPYGLAIDALPLAKNLASPLVKKTGKSIKDAYNKVATGNSFLPVAWKMEESSGLSSVSNLKNLTDDEARVLASYINDPYTIPRSSTDSKILENLVKTNKADLSQSNKPITKILDYYVETKKNPSVVGKYGEKIVFPGTRSWSLGTTGKKAYQGKQRLVIPSKYSKDLDYFSVPYEDERVIQQLIEKNPEMTKHILTERELLGNIPEGFKVIGSSDEQGYKNIFIKPLKNKQYGGPIYNNMAGKLNKRKGLPSRFPMYNPGGYTNPDDRRVNRLSQSLLSEWDYDTQYDPYKSKIQPALGSNPDSNNNGVFSNDGNIDMTTQITNEERSNKAANLFSLLPTAISVAGAFTQKPQGQMDYGTSDYFQNQNLASARGKAMTNVAAKGLSMIPGWGKAASVGLQGAQVLGDIISQKDQYGIAASAPQQHLGAILDPVGSLTSIASGQNPFDYGKMKSEKNKLVTDFTKKQTTQIQDAYNQAVKAQEGQFMAMGGRMVNPYNGEPNAEIEGEVVNHANGGIQDFSHLPDHEQATTANEVSLAPKTFIFSKRIKNPVTGRPFATDAKRYTTTSEEKIFDNKQATPITSKTAKLMFSVKKQLADNLAELHEATKVYNGAQKAENEATEEFIGMLGGMYGKGGLIKRKDGSYSPRGLWDNIRANKGSGKKPTKAMLEQERKIKAQEKAMGGYMYKDGGSFNNPGFKALPGYVQAKIKGNYEYGGYTLGESYDMSEDEIKELKRQGYTFDIE